MCSYVATLPEPPLSYMYVLLNVLGDWSMALVLLVPFKYIFVFS